jgi:hypothetical protein
LAQRLFIRSAPNFLLNNVINFGQDFESHCVLQAFFFYTTTASASTTTTATEKTAPTPIPTPTTAAAGTAATTTVLLLLFRLAEWYTDGYVSTISG